MSGKAKRTWLFRVSKPVIRPFEAKDRGFLWAAHLSGAFGLSQDLTQEVFLLEMANRFGIYSLVWIVEDDCSRFRSGRGPVALVGINTDGWVYRPTPIWFPWSRKRHILRACVAFLQMIRYRKEVGCCIIQADRRDTQMLDHMQKYGVLYARGRIPMGSEEGDVFMYSMTGKKSVVAFKMAA